MPDDESAAVCERPWLVMTTSRFAELSGKTTTFRRARRRPDGERSRRARRPARPRRPPRRTCTAGHPGWSLSRFPSGVSRTSAPRQPREHPKWSRHPAPRRFRPGTRALDRPRAARRLSAARTAAGAVRAGVSRALGPREPSPSPAPATTGVEAPGTTFPTPSRRFAGRRIDDWRRAATVRET